MYNIAFFHFPKIETQFDHILSLLLLLIQFLLELVVLLNLFEFHKILIQFLLSIDFIHERGLGLVPNVVVRICQILQVVRNQILHHFQFTLLSFGYLFKDKALDISVEEKSPCNNLLIDFRFAILLLLLDQSRFALVLGHVRSLNQFQGDQQLHALFLMTALGQQMQLVDIGQFHTCFQVHTLQ